MRVEYRLDGPEGAPVLVLANSLGTTIRLWEPNLPHWTESLRVLRFDQRGHGRAEAPVGSCTVADLGRDVLELLDLLGIDRVAFCGLSLGGATGLWLAANAPDRIAGLVVACSSARFGDPVQWLERAATVRAEGTAAVADIVLERWFTRRFFETSPAVVERHRRMLVGTPAEGYAACCEATAAWDFREELAAVSAGTLVLAGADDPATPVEHARLIAGRVPRARLVVLPGAAHLANVEQPDAFAAAVKDHVHSSAPGFHRARGAAHA